METRPRASRAIAMRRYWFFGCVWPSGVFSACRHPGRCLLQGITLLRHFCGTVQLWTDVAAQPLMVARACRLQEAVARLVHCLGSLEGLQADDRMHDPHPRVVRVNVLLDQMSCRAQGRLEVGLMAVSLHQLAGGPPDVCFRKQCPMCPVERINRGHSLGPRRVLRYPSKELTSDISSASRTLRGGIRRVSPGFLEPCFKSGQ